MDLILLGEIGYVERALVCRRSVFTRPTTAFPHALDIPLVLKDTMASESV